MFSLTKRLLVFWVFSIVCNLTTSDEIRECIDNLHEVFIESNDASRNFKIALAALSKNLIDSFNESESIENYLHNYYKSQSNFISSLGNNTISEEHDEVMSYFNFLHTWIINPDKNEGDASSSSSSALESSSMLGKSSPRSKKADILGYFQSFSKRIKENAYMINFIVLSPKQFCDSVRGYGYMTESASSASDDSEKICIQALCTMFNLRELDPKTEASILIKKTGSQALQYCFQKYTYLDFTMQNFFPQQVGSAYVQHSMYLDSSIKQKQIDIMIRYFSYMISVAIDVGRTNKQKNFEPSRKYVPHTHKASQIFLTVEEYCESAVQNKQ